MPAEILNQLESLIPEMEASAANENIGSCKKTGPVDQLESDLRAMKFIWNLPIITIDFLHEDEKLCGLCDRKYDDEFKVCSRGEVPSLLPCGHVAGHQCLRAWLSPYEYGYTKCPFAGCRVNYPQMFRDAAEPVQPTSDLARLDSESDDELSRQVSQLSKDSGASSNEVKRYLSIDEVLKHSRSQTERLYMGTEVQDFATQDDGPAEIGEEEFPKSRKNAASPILIRAAMKAVDLIAKGKKEGSKVKLDRGTG